VRESGCFIGLDPSYTGFGFAAFFEPSWVYELHFFKWDKAKYTCHSDRLAAIRDDLTACLRTFPDITMVAIEGYAHGAKYRREQMGELGAAVRLALYDAAEGENWRDPLVVPPSSLKQYAADYGRAKKGDMIEACSKNWQVEVSDDNLADAYCLARYAADQHYNDK
jgi:Holliday junction resolvasome RuvABC endonuclease subunit